MQDPINFKYINMKKFCFCALAIMAVLISMHAQNVIKVVTKEGNTIKYNPENIARIEFYPDEIGADNGIFTVVPKEGVVKKLDSFVFTFTNYSDIKLSDNCIAFLYADGTAAPLDYMRPTVSGNTVKISLTKPIESGGVYSVVIPADFLTMTETATGATYSNEEVRVTYLIEGGSLQAPMVGDFYYSDGTWSTSLLKKDGVEPIGIVFFVGINNGAGDNAAYYTTKEGKSMRESFNGYVISLTDATMDATGNNHEVAWSFFDGGDPGCGCSVSETDFKGYTNTEAIKSRADKDYGGLADKTVNFPATYYACVAFDKTVPAPAQSSGWFLPSAGQFNYIMNSVYYLTNGMNESTPYIQKSLNVLKENGYKVKFLDQNGTRYWTSNEQYDSSGHSYRALRARTGADYSGGYAIAWANKNAGGTYVRAILAF